MSTWLIWITIGILFMFLEVVVPGGIIVFLGIAAAIVGGAIYYGFINSIVHALITWFVLSLIFLFALRSFFMKYFEGDSFVQNVDEDVDSVGQIVEVIEKIQPSIEGRVKYLDSTWIARSEEILEVGSHASIISRDGSTWVVKSIEE